MENNLIQKAYTSIMEPNSYDAKEHSIIHIITTENEDLYGDIVIANGVKCPKKPKVLASHSTQYTKGLTIGKNAWFKPTDDNNGLKAKTIFAPSPDGQLYEMMYAGEFMTDFSIGFISIKERPNEKTGGRIFDEWELLEYSCVALGANRQAITMGYEKAENPEIKRLFAEPYFHNKIEELENEVIRLKGIDLSGYITKKDYEELIEKYEAIKNQNNEFIKQFITKKDEDSKNRIVKKIKSVESTLKK